MEFEKLREKFVSDFKFLLLYIAELNPSLESRNFSIQSVRRPAEH